ncbi:MAG: mechanosensitive ion channel family protein, partial [Bacteroidota bacterium]
FASVWDRIWNDLMSWMVNNGPEVVALTISFIISLFLIKVIIRRFQKYLYRVYEERGDLEGKKRIVTLSELLRTTLQVVISAIFTLALLSQFGVKIGPLLAGAGIAGLAVGFGAQELVRDVISGFFMILENQIRVGDVVTINGTSGGVEEIEVRTVTLRDFSGTTHVFQNGKINSLSNMTKGWSAVVFDIGVAYKENPDEVMAVIDSVGADLQQDELHGPNIIEPIEVSGLDRFGQSEIIIKARLKTAPGSQWAIGREYRKRLKLAFDEKGIEIPFPHRTIFWGDKVSPINAKSDLVQE